MKHTSIKALEQQLRAPFTSLPHLFFLAIPSSYERSWYTTYIYKQLKMHIPTLRMEKKSTDLRSIPQDISSLWMDPLLLFYEGGNIKELQPEWVDPAFLQGQYIVVGFNGWSKELEEFFAQNKHQYKSKELRQISYVTFSKNNFINDFKISDWFIKIVFSF